MKRPAAAKKNPVPAKCREIAKAIYETDVPERVQEMLAGTVENSLGQLKASRHSLSERFVVMIGETFSAYKASLEKDVSEKEAALAELTPSKGVREEAVEAAKSSLTSSEEALEKAKQAVKDINNTVKEARVSFKAKEVEQAEGDKVLQEIEAKLAELERIDKDCLSVILAGEPEPEEKDKMLKAVVDAAKNFQFDVSLMEASIKVLQKAKDDRGEGFDETCLSQLKASFASSVSTLQAQVAEGAPAKAARAAVVQEAADATASAEKTQEQLVEEAKKAKEAKEAAAEVVKNAKESLSSFLPDLKTAGAAVDTAKAKLQSFIEGPLASYEQLKDLTEETFKEPEVEAEEEKPAEVAAASEKADEAPQEDAEGEPAAKKARTDTAGC
jgi:chromosome segregation ATPase